MSNQPTSGRPTASLILAFDLLHLVRQCSLHRQTYKGTIDTARSLARGTAQLVVLAADAHPLETLELVQVLCAERDVPHVSISSKTALGRACGVFGDVIAVAITADQGAGVGGYVKVVKEKVERLMGSVQVDQGDFLISFGF